MIPVSTAGGGFPFPILPAVVIAPALFSVALFFLPRRSRTLAKAVGIGGSLVTLGLALAMAVRFRSGVPGYQFVVSHSWISAFGVSWKLGVDGISVFLVASTAVLFTVATAGTSGGDDPKGYMAWMLLLEAACLGSFLSLDLFLFFLFFELTLPPMYMLIGKWGSENRTYAALKFFIYTFAGSALMLIAILGLVFIDARTTGQVTFDLIAHTSLQHVSSGMGIVLFLGFAAAFAVKIPVFPFHTWLPDAQVEAPTGGSMVLAGALFNLGTYGLVRFCIELFPRASADLAPLMLTLGAIGIVYGFLVAVVQTDLKRMIAYTLVADLGVVVVGLFGLTTQGISGGVYQMVNHGVSMAAMFLVIGMVVDRLGTRQLSAMGGLQARTPILAAVFIAITLSIIGVPGLNGFVGEFVMLLGTFLTHRWWAVAGAFGMILSSLVFLWAYQQVFHGRAAPATAGLRVPDLGWRETAVVAPLLFLIVLLGVYPRPFFDRINPSADRVMAHVTQVTGQSQPAVASGGRP